MSRDIKVSGHLGIPHNVILRMSLLISITSNVLRAHVVPGTVESSSYLCLVVPPSRAPYSADGVAEAQGSAGLVPGAMLCSWGKDRTPGDPKIYSRFWESR